jgi:hypothetical protein
MGARAAVVGGHRWTVDPVRRSALAAGFGLAVTGLLLTPVSSGATSLRYDSTGQQFIQNWKTPAGAGSYKVTLTTQDGSVIEAVFTLRK